MGLLYTGSILCYRCVYHFTTPINFDKGVGLEPTISFPKRFIMLNFAVMIHKLVSKKDDCIKYNIQKSSYKKQLTMLPHISE